MAEVSVERNHMKNEWKYLVWIRSWEVNKSQPQNKRPAANEKTKAQLSMSPEINHQSGKEMNKVKKTWDYA